MFNNWNFEDCRQFWTLFPHTPDNSFLGFVVDSNQRNSTLFKSNQAVLYGKEGWYAYGKEAYLNTIGETMELHSTFKVGGVLASEFQPVDVIKLTRSGYRSKFTQSCDQPWCPPGS